MRIVSILNISRTFQKTTKRFSCTKRAMTKQQFSDAVAIAQSETDLTTVDDTILYGCGLPDFKAVTVTLEAAAKFIRWHCMMLNGSMDSEALNEMRNISRKKWMVA